MNLRGSDRLRVLLMGAVASGVFGHYQFNHAGPIPVPAKSKAPAGTKPQPAPTAPALLPEAGAEPIIQPVSQTELAATSTGKKSEVMKQLELLYQQDGKEMPEMNTDIKPVPTNPTAPGTPGQQNVPAAQPQNGLRTQQPTAGQRIPSNVQAPVAPAAPAPQPPKSKNPVVAFFKKLVPGGNKDPKPSQAPADYRPDVAPQPPVVASQPPAQLRSEPAFEPKVATVDPSLPLLDATPRTPFIATLASVPDPLPKPLADLGEIPPSPDADSALATQAGLLPPLLADAAPASIPATEEIPSAPASDTSSPFTEMSEADADKKLELNPFTGLTLNEDAGSANAPKNDAPADASAPDPFADELKKLGIEPPGAEPTAKPATPAGSPTFEGIEDQATREKMKKIHERGSMKGLKGFCPVTLRDQRELVDAKPDFHATFRGQKFHFADADAKLKFDEEPARYAPAAYGADVVALTRDKDVVEGSLDFAAWYKGRLYLFGSQEAHDTFVANPAQYATPVGIE